MPIIIHDDSADVKKISTASLQKSAALAAQKKLQDPKFFSKSFTGTGKSTGVLCISMDPLHIPKHIKGFTQPTWNKDIKNNSFTKVTAYPLHPLGCVKRNGNVAADPHYALIGKNNYTELYINLEPQTLYLMDYLGVTANGIAGSTAAKPVKEHKLVYRCEIIEHDIQSNLYQVLDTQFLFNPMEDVATIAANYKCFDPKLFTDYLSTYSAYDEVSRMSELWQTKIAEIILAEIDRVEWINASSYDPKKPAPVPQNLDICTMNFPVEHILKYLSNYKLSLDRYRELYDGLSKRFNLDSMQKFTRINTSLLLHQTVDALSNTQFAPFPTATGTPMNLSFYSTEQVAAITSTAPLNIVQAGAGTGKSTTVNARLQYMKSLGIDMRDVMVLSFTNAAADHITEICPGVQSMTIAKMLDTIYKTAHPTHQLSSSDIKGTEGATFQNSLAMYKGSSPVVDELIRASDANSKHNDYSLLLQLCENHHDDVIAILDKISQTTFAIELVICYLDYKTMQIPFNIKYLMIDEVQDNAEFEFIFFLNMTSIVKNHLYLVGDSSQTLFEFRASNPKAINAIENSGIFKTFPLSTNYRSNQCILEFANVLLQSIEANAIAKLQLQAFSLQPITQQDFLHHVTLDYNQINKTSEVMPSKYHTGSTLVETKFRTDIMKWIDQKLAANEQVCILTHYGRDVRAVEELCRKIWSTKTVVNISPEKNWSFGYFSRYISDDPNRLLALPTQSVDALMNRLTADIINYVQNQKSMNPNAPNYQVIMNKVRTYTSEWMYQEYKVIEAELLRFQQGQITMDQLAKTIGQSLIDFEIEKNGLAQTLSSAKNAKRKVDTANADILLCTIHSAKGLEFDNTVVLYKNDNQITQEDMRMYYVALTRAKNAEYVLAWGTTMNSLIEKYYTAALQSLPPAPATVTTATVPAATAAVNASAATSAIAQQGGTLAADVPATVPMATAAVNASATTSVTAQQGSIILDEINNLMTDSAPAAAQGGTVVADIPADSAPADTAQPQACAPVTVMPTAPVIPAIAADNPPAGDIVDTILGNDQLTADLVKCFTSEYRETAPVIQAHYPVIMEPQAPAEDN